VRDCDSQVASHRQSHLGQAGFGCKVNGWRALELGLRSSGMPRGT
jgi:hypothetical protein